MIYKNMTFCTAYDCAKLDCRRNTRGYNFTPNEFWRNKVAFGPFRAENCMDYVSEKNVFNEKTGKCFYLCIYDDGEDSNGIPCDAFFCKKRLVWLDDNKICQSCKGKWNKEQVENETM